MTIAKKSEASNIVRRKIVWASFLILDIHLHKTTQLEILENLAKRGYKTSLVAIHSQNTTQRENSQIRIISIPLRYVPMLSTIVFALTILFFLPFYIVVSKPDFIITEPEISILGFISAIPFSKLKKVKLLLDIRSTPVETVGVNGFLRRFWFSVSIIISKRFFNGMTIITPLMRKEVCNKFNINPDTMGVWTTGVSPTLFNPENYISEGKRLKRELELSSKFVVLYHGTFTATRGLTETVKAMKIVRQKYPNIVFFLLGTGPIVHSLRALIQTESLQENVIIHDTVDQSEVPKFISMCDACIISLPDHPYWRFQCPTKLLEYLAMEKVAIATDIPATRLIIGSEKCGIYVSSAEPIDLAKGIEYAYNNKDKLHEWGKIGRRIVEEKYTWEKVVADLDSFLLSVE